MQGLDSWACIDEICEKMHLESEHNFKLCEVQYGLPNVNLEKHKINQDIFVICANGKYINFIF
jgi:hypothetical protein